MISVAQNCVGGEVNINLYRQTLVSLKDKCVDKQSFSTPFSREKLVFSFQTPFSNFKQTSGSRFLKAHSAFY